MIVNILKNKYISNNIFSLLGNVLQAGIAFATFLILVRYTDKMIFGKWIIFVSVATLMDMFRLGLTGMATIRLISLSKNTESQKESMGSSYQLSLISTGITLIVFWLIYLLIIQFFPTSEYAYIFLYYPILAICNIPYYQATINLQGQNKFGTLSVLKILNASFIVILVVANILLNNALDLQSILTIYIIANLTTSIFSTLKKWDGIIYLKHANKKVKTEILNFGKYSTASYIGSNLLKSADTLIIGLIPFFGAEAVAIYAIPFKFVEMVEVILRSFTSTAFPALSKSLKQHGKTFYLYLINYISITTLILMPVVVLLFLFPEFFLQIMGGNKYIENLELQKNMLYIICAYLVILPSDRFTGVALFAMNKSDLNFYKILFMLILNIIFDVIAVLVFKSLVMVVMATFLFTMFGLLLGWKFVKDTAANQYQLNIYIKEIVKANQELLKKWINPQAHIAHPKP